MNLQKAKIYHDGSHFIAIPQGAYSSGKGCKRQVVKPTEQLTLTNESPPETLKERFETAYQESLSLPKKERKKHIKEALESVFTDKAELQAFVDKNLERMKTNAIKRKVRLMRKLRPSKGTVSTIVTLLPATIDFSPVALSAAVVWIVISGSYSSVSVPKSITVLFLETTTSKAGISVIPLLESQRNSSIV